MTRVQGLVAGFSGLIGAATVWGVWTSTTFTRAIFIALVGFALTAVGVILFTVVLEESPRA